MWYYRRSQRHYHHRHWVGLWYSFSRCNLNDGSANSLQGLTNGGFRVKKASNVILRNLKLHVAPESKDLIELQYSTNVWIDHCDVSETHWFPGHV
jgi:hypothetical protein